MNDEIQQKLKKLQEYILAQGSMAVAFSGGVDSTFLLSVAQEVLGDKAIAVTGCSPSFPERERKEAEAFCRELGVRQIFVESGEMEAEGYRQNPKNRCYLCKKAIFSKILRVAAEAGCNVVAEGSNMDDNGDYRPGLMAVAELDIKSPLREAGLYKEEIRELSRERNLPTWDKPSFACLASRFVYGEEISEKKLHMVEEAEQLLLDLGFRQMRVRIHGENMARIEVLPEDFPHIMEQKVRDRILKEFRRIGFLYVTMDLAGYRTGSMNEAIKK